MLCCTILSQPISPACLLEDHHFEQRQSLLNVSSFEDPSFGDGPGSFFSMFLKMEAEEDS